MKMPAMLPARSPAQWHRTILPRPKACRDVVCHLKRILRLAVLRLRGRAQDEFTLAAIAQNLTPPREVRHLHHSPWRALRKRRIHQYQCVEADALFQGARQARVSRALNAPPSPGTSARNPPTNAGRSPTVPGSPARGDPVAYSITLSARSRIDWGMLMPSAFAVSMLTISSNLVGCSTGMSPGFSPLRILSTMAAVRRKMSY